jgi:hypothetical protein
MKRTFVVLAAAALLAGMVATDALAAGHSGFGGGHIGGRFGPLTGSAPMPSPIYNPSAPYTVTQPARDPRLAGKPWISISLTAEHGGAGVDRPFLVTMWT